MTGSTLATQDMDVRRRKLLFRAWHRGMREMDLILGQYADAYLISFSDAGAIPAEFDTPLFRDIVAFRDRIEF